MPSTGVEFKYALGTCLFEGDRQAVYETESEGRPAVVKFIRPQTSFEAAKLVSQLAAAARLRHPNLAQIFDFGETEIFETHVVYVVSERGQDRSADAHGDIAAALAFLHTNGYSHGSVKPSNVFAFGDVVKLSAESIHPAEDGDKEADVDALNSILGEGEGAANPVPLYRKHAVLAIGGVAAAAALCLLLMRNAEHKAPPAPVPTPIAVQQQLPTVAAEPQKLSVAPRSHPHRRARARHKRK